VVSGHRVALGKRLQLGHGRPAATAAAAAAAAARLLSDHEA